MKASICLLCMLALACGATGPFWRADEGLGALDAACQLLPECAVAYPDIFQLFGALFQSESATQRLIAFLADPSATPGAACPAAMLSFN